MIFKMKCHHGIHGGVEVKIVLSTSAFSLNKNWRRQVSSKESVDEILKEIVMKAVSEYLDQPVNPNLPKINTKKNIATRTGISESTLNRYTMPETKSYPNLVEVMEILRVTDKRQYLMDFANKSKCQAAQFVKEFYPKYINEHQIQSEAFETVSSNDEVLRLINEHQSALDKKHKNHYMGIAITFGAAFFIIYLHIVNEIYEIKALLSK